MFKKTKAFKKWSEDKDERCWDMAQFLEQQTENLVEAFWKGTLWPADYMFFLIDKYEKETGETALVEGEYDDIIRHAEDRELETKTEELKYISNDKLQKLSLAVRREVRNRLSRERDSDTQRKIDELVANEGAWCRENIDSAADFIEGDKREELIIMSDEAIDIEWEDAGLGDDMRHREEIEEGGDDGDNS